MFATSLARYAAALNTDGQYAKSLEAYRQLCTRSGGGDLRVLSETDSCCAAHALVRLGKAKELIALFEHRILKDESNDNMNQQRRRALAFAYIEDNRPAEAIAIVLKNDHSTEARFADPPAQRGQDLVPLVPAYALAGKAKEADKLLQEGMNRSEFTRFKGIEQAANALIGASLHDTQRFEKAIDEVLLLPFADTSPRQHRDALLDGIFTLKLCAKAAKQMKDKRREVKLNELRAQLQQEFDQI